MGVRTSSAIPSRCPGMTSFWSGSSAVRAQHGQGAPAEPPSRDWQPGASRRRNEPSNAPWGALPVLRRDDADIVAGTQPVTVCGQGAPP